MQTDEELRSAIVGTRVRVWFRKPDPDKAPYGSNWFDGRWQGVQIGTPGTSAEIVVPADTVCRNGAALLNVRVLRGTETSADVPPSCREVCVPQPNGEFVECPKRTFLEMDLRDAFHWLLIAAERWKRKEGDHARAFQMFTAVMQARALYEFFYKKPSSKKPSSKKQSSDDSALAIHFLNPQARVRFNRGTSSQDTAALDIDGRYAKYMAPQAPAQKRSFHLVYDRSEHAGGRGHEGHDHIREQVGAFAVDLVRVFKEFIKDVDVTYLASARYALPEAQKGRSGVGAEPVAAPGGASRRR